jgi:phosphoribosylformylglycinamidine (FGAM) synthase PurS component
MIIEVWTKDKYAHNEEAGLLARLKRAGLDIKMARLSRLYKIEAPWTKKDFDRLGGELLTDNITEHYSLSKRLGIKGCWRVEIWLKNSATDVIGESVKEAIHDMLGRSPSNVRFGRAYYAVCSGEEKLRAVVAKTLMNEVVNICSIKEL